jgi:CubicO group peptidase (beta-lactamase class C family)
MVKKGKKIVYGLLIVIAAVIIGASIYLNSLLPIITGYAAKNLCSAVFISGRDAREVENLDLNFSFIKFTKNEVSKEDKSVTSRFLWGKSKAIFREGFGVTLLRDIGEEELRKTVFPQDTDPNYLQDTISWPLGNLIPDSATGINVLKLNNISEKVIREDAYNGHVFAFLVMHKGIPVAESYKPEFNNRTRFLSWSMAKSFTNALVGIMVRDGRFDVNKPVNLEAWKNDERSSITLNNLMQMESGLKWNEDYGNKSDVTVMLHCESDMGKYAFEKPLEFPVGTHWYYSSGTTNIVDDIIQNQFNNISDYYAFAEKELFNKIGMPDAVFEVDPSGTIVGSSYLYATARDYARFALLYMNDGVFNGSRILPEGWVKYSTTEASDSKGQYGAFFWLNRSKKIPSAPEDTFSCNGHNGQFIFMIPSKELAVVILGYSPAPNNIDLDRLLKDILSTLE